MTKKEELEKIYAGVMSQWDSIAKPIDGLGDMERILARIGAIQGELIPRVKRRTLLVFLADNGITAEGVTQSDSSVTHSVAEAMAKKNSTVCVMARRAYVNVLPVDIGMKGEPVPGITFKRIREGTGDFYIEPAMTLDETQAAIDVGKKMAAGIIEEGCDLLLLGEMGIGNTSTATALSCALLGLDAADFVGRGAGLTEDKLSHKREIITGALKKQDFDRDDTMGILSLFGGFDIAGMVGAILEASDRRVPIVADGLITLAAILVAERLNPGIRDYCIASHKPAEPMGERLLKELSYKAPIDAGLALGEGTGAVLLMPLLDVCFSLFTEGTRFGGLGIDAYERYEKEAE